MMMKTATTLPETLQTVLETLHREQVIGVIRSDTADDALWAAEQLIDCGFKGIEITFTVPQADLVLQTLCDRYPDVLLGAGSVMNPLNGIKALGAGARFLVSPVLDESMIRWGIDHQVLTFPGALTPSEIHRAFCLGAPAVKVFPAQQAGGPDYLKALIEPLGALPLIPTGGIGPDTFTDYLRNGALAVGLGGHLVPAAAIGERNEAEIRRRAGQFQKKLQQFRDQKLQDRS